MSHASTSSGHSIDLLMEAETAAVGAAWIPVAADGPRWPVVDDPIARWRERLLVGSPAIRRSLERSLDRCLAAGAGPVELMPGVWAIGCEGVDGHDRSRGVILLATRTLFAEGSLAMLCSTARLDEKVVRGLAETTEPPSDDAVDSIARLLRRAHEAALERIRDRESQQSVDRRLADSYEELHLLNSLIDGLVVGGDADEFLRKACAELSATAGYRWIALLVDESSAIGDDDQVRHGEAVPERTRLREIAALAEDAIATAVDAGEHGEVGVAAIRGGGRRMGTLLAGGRPGEPISSIELTLLASAAGHVGVFLRNAMLYADLDAMFLGTLQAMVAAIDAKDPYTRGHSQRVALLSRDLAAAIGLPETFVRDAHLAGLVHDIGKIGVPESVLRKAGRLDDDEFAMIRRHPQIGHRILKDIPQVRELLPGVLCHHEAWDGSGYPAGMEGEEIPLLARIIAICDSFDAMSSSRTYRRAMPRAEVLEEIRRCAGRFYDPRLVPVFLGLDFAEYDRLLARDAAELIRAESDADGDPPRRTAA